MLAANGAWPCRALLQPEPRRPHSAAPFPWQVGLLGTGFMEVMALGGLGGDSESAWAPPGAPLPLARVVPQEIGGPCLPASAHLPWPLRPPWGSLRASWGGRGAAGAALLGAPGWLRWGRSSAPSGLGGRLAHAAGDVRFRTTPARPRCP